jgi:hypothetical protein
MAYLLPYLANLLHLHTLYIDFSIVLMTVRLFMCVVCNVVRLLNEESQTEMQRVGYS